MMMHGPAKVKKKSYTKWSVLGPHFSVKERQQNATKQTVLGFIRDAAAYCALHGAFQCRKLKRWFVCDEVPLKRTETRVRKY
jgi:hypothetical protein